MLVKGQLCGRIEGTMILFNYHLKANQGQVIARTLPHHQTSGTHLLSVYNRNFIPTSTSNFQLPQFAGLGQGYGQDYDQGYHPHTHLHSLTEIRNLWLLNLKTATENDAFYLSSRYYFGSICIFVQINPLSHSNTGQVTINMILISLSAKFNLH